MKVVILAIIIVAICFLLLGVKVLFVRGGRFPSGHTHSAAFRSRGIGCAHGTDAEPEKPKKSH